MSFPKNTHRFAPGMRVMWGEPNERIKDFMLEVTRGRHGAGPFVIAEVLDASETDFDPSLRLVETKLGQDVWVNAAFFKPTPEVAQ